MDSWWRDLVPRLGYSVAALKTPEARDSSAPRLAPARPSNLKLSLPTKRHAAQLAFERRDNLNSTRIERVLSIRRIKQIVLSIYETHRQEALRWTRWLPRFRTKAPTVLLLYSGALRSPFSLLPFCGHNNGQKTAPKTNVFGDMKY